MTEKPAKPARPPGLMFIFVTLLLDIMGMGLIIPVLPQLVGQFYGGDLSAAATAFGAIAAVYTLMQFLFAPLLGALSDRFGRKPILLFSLLGTALSYALMAVAPSLFWLYVSRVLAGIAGASITVASTYIADISPPEQRAQNFGMIGAAFGIGFIAGPALGGALGGISLQLPFWVAAVVSLLNFFYGWFGVPESHKVENRRPFDRKAANPFNVLASLREYPLLLGLVGGFVAMGLAQQCLYSTWTIFTTYRFHWSPMENGLSLAIVGLGAAVVQGGLIRHILPALGERKAILYGMSLSAVVMLLYGLATHSWMMYAILVFGSLGGIAGPAIQGLVSKQIGPEAQGRVQGSLTSLMSLTGIIGPLIANQAFGFFTGPQAPVKLPGIAFFLGAAFSVASVILTLRVLNRLPETAPPAGEPSEQVVA